MRHFVAASVACLLVDRAAADDAAAAAGSAECADGKCAAAEESVAAAEAAAEAGAAAAAGTEEAPTAAEAGGTEEAPTADGDAAVHDGAEPATTTTTSTATTTTTTMTAPTTTTTTVPAEPEDPPVAEYAPDLAGFADERPDAAARVPTEPNEFHMDSPPASLFDDLSFFGVGTLRPPLAVMCYQRRSRGNLACRAIAALVHTLLPGPESEHLDVQGATSTVTGLVAEVLGDDAAVVPSDAEAERWLLLCHSADGAVGCRTVRVSEALKASESMQAMDDGLAAASLGGSSTEAAPAVESAVEVAAAGSADGGNAEKADVVAEKTEGVASEIHWPTLTFYEDAVFAPSGSKVLSATVRGRQFSVCWRLLGEADVTKAVRCKAGTALATGGIAVN